ncbi:hypothetical protein MHYP_G00088940 [Metynnis hypsauchen]
MNETLNLENQEESRKQDGLVLSETSRLDLPDDVGEISRPTRDVQNSAKIPKMELLKTVNQVLQDCGRQFDWSVVERLARARNVKLSKTEERRRSSSW